MLSIPLSLPLVAVQVWMPVSPEWIAPRMIVAAVEVWKGQALQVDDHWKVGPDPDPPVAVHVTTTREAALYSVSEDRVKSGGRT